MGRETNSGKVVLTVWVTRAGRDRLDAIAAKTGFSRSEVLRAAIRAGLDPAEEVLLKERRAISAKQL